MKPSWHGKHVRHPWRGRDIQRGPAGTGWTFPLRNGLKVPVSWGAFVLAWWTPVSVVLDQIEGG